jgi:hypothetical protein
MRRFVGVRDADGRTRVYVDDDGNPGAPRRRLQHRRHVYSHSPTGFDWGYAGSGPAELARALVSEVTGDPEPSPRVYQTFKARVVQALPAPGWALEEGEVQRVVGQIARELAR